MGGAKSSRRRAKLLLDAQHGNLYKAQFGKASKWDKLPDAPSAKQRQPVVSRNFKKMQALMEIAKPDYHGAKRSNGLEDPSRARKRQKTCQGAAEAAIGATGGASVAARDGASGASTSGADLSGAQQPAGQRALRSDMVVGAFESTAVSKTKMKCKQVLDEKKRLKKLKRQVAQLGGGKHRNEEEEGVHRLKEDVIAFGETAAAPPKVTLKRRHWDADQAGVATQQRNKDIMAKYMQAAERRVAKRSGAPASVLQRQQVHQQEQIRNTLVQAYRDQKRGSDASVKHGTHRGTKAATLQSLKALVLAKTSL